MNFTLVPFRRSLVRLMQLTIMLLLPFCGDVLAFTAVAMVPDHAGEAFIAAWNHPTQREADRAAIDGCRTAAKSSGIASLANKCVVSMRQKGVGGGAMTCGDAGCTAVAGYETKQAAADAAYQRCIDFDYGNCNGTEITVWWDEAGYKPTFTQAKAPMKQCGPPPGKTVRSRTQCTNGACVRTFENGCAVQFQAAYCHNPFTSQWEWKPDGC